MLSSDKRPSDQDPAVRSVVLPFRAVTPLEVGAVHSQAVSRGAGSGDVCNVDMARTRSPWLGPAARPVAIPEDDVRFYVEVGELVELLEELVLPPTVRRAWADWFLRHRGPTLSSGRPRVRIVNRSPS